MYQEPPIVSKEVLVEETLRKTVDIETNEYDCEDTYQEWDGSYEMTANFENTDWENEYGNNHYTIKELLFEVSNFLENISDNLLDIDKLKAKKLIEECNGWEQSDISFTTNKRMAISL